jgi:hypothetical protein
MPLSLERESRERRSTGRTYRQSYESIGSLAGVRAVGGPAISRHAGPRPDGHFDFIVLQYSSNRSIAIPIRGTSRQ